MPLRNILLLLCCQLISATGSIVFVTLGGIIGSGLASNPALATLPISLMVVSTAATTIPATILMRHVGRRRGFAMASLSAMLAMLLAAYALSNSSFGWFIAASLVFGINLAFTQQYRYAAAESVQPKFASRAISFVLIGAIGGAVLGPELVTRGQFWFSGTQYSGTLVAVSVLFVVQANVFLLLGPLRGEGEDRPADDQRPLPAIIKQPVFIVAVLGGTVGYGVMVLIMTATPLSMHIDNGHTLEQTAQVIRAHVLGMYLPSLVSGFLIEKLGVVRMMFVGGACLMLACGVGMQGQSVMHYWYALVLLGVGWNFLYVGGTTMLTLTYSISERFRAQAVNEFSVFGTAATASLLAGTVIYYYGWSTLVFVPLPMLLLILVALLIVRKDPLLKRPALAID